MPISLVKPSECISVKTGRRFLSPTIFDEKAPLLTNFREL